MKWILLISWAANGTGFTMQEFDTKEACFAAYKWTLAAYTQRGGPMRLVCMSKATGEIAKP
jgi:hypothetical protein